MEDSGDSFEQHVVIAGVGLIGGSIAAAVRQRFPTAKVTGIGRDVSKLQQARDAGLLTHTSCDLTPALFEDGPLVVVCLPVHLIADFVISAADVSSPRTLITDAGSVKASICKRLAQFPDAAAQFVGSHPIAGGEQSGFEFADADLFEGRTCVIVPPESHLKAAERVDRVERFWRQIGCIVMPMSAEDHDRVLALTSHLPHIMAAMTTSAVGAENLPLTGSGFRDTTRIAAGNAALWRAILCNNRGPVISAIDSASKLLSEFREALQAEDDSLVERLLQDARTQRISLPQE
ncbi:MAG: prephenate dehydrogenase/arogenate dehydrogenase family protein [Planctomycetaceae bacterium]|nr:prephenate dehydrogenase/arogenate dehydrogenase family protein [Planctomycetaceae bacterium]